MSPAVLAMAWVPAAALRLPVALVVVDSMAHWAWVVLAVVSVVAEEVEVTMEEEVAAILEVEEGPATTRLVVQLRAPGVAMASASSLSSMLRLSHPL